MQWSSEEIAQFKSLVVEQEEKVKEVSRRSSFEERERSFFLREKECASHSRPFSAHVTFHPFYSFSVIVELKELRFEQMVNDEATTPLRLRFARAAQARKEDLERREREVSSDFWPCYLQCFIVCRLFSSFLFVSPLLTFFRTDGENKKIKSGKNCKKR